MVHIKCLAKVFSPLESHHHFMVEHIFLSSIFIVNSNALVLLTAKQVTCLLK